MTNDPRYEVDEDNMVDNLRKLSSFLNDRIPDGYGFTLFLFSYSGRGFYYMSSADRADMIKVLKEFIQREEAQ